MKAPTKEQLLNDVISDLTWKEIAEKYGYSDPRFLRKLANRYDLPKRRVILKPSEETLRNLILVEGMTPQQAAVHLGYGEGGWSNIYKYCRNYGITFDYSINHDLRSTDFSQRQKDICLGSLLGDAYLRPSGNNAALSFTHGQKQLDYLRWKYDEFSNFVTAKEFYSCQNEFRGNRPTFSFSTVSHPFLGWARKLCYPEGRKKVSSLWLSQLSALSLAVWYMDDGSINKRYRTIVLCTNSFSVEEQQLIIEYFKNSWGIEAKLEPRRNGQFVVRINASRSKAFLDIVAPHIPDCMNYKLG